MSTQELGVQGVKQRWNRAEVINRAGVLVDTRGLGALTLTSLAAELGIRPPSLFNHLDSLQGLVKDLAERSSAELADRMEAAAVGEGRPSEVLGRVMDAYRSYVTAHPGCYAATLTVPRTEAEDRIVATGLTVAGQFGLSGAEALHRIRAWRALAHGFCDLERQGGFGLPLDCDESWRRAILALTPEEPA